MIFTYLKKLRQFIINFLFPITCINCEKEDCIVCEKCWLEVKEIQDIICPYCEQKSLQGKICQICIEKNNNIFYLNSLNVLWVYEKHRILAKLLHGFKYDLLLEYGYFLAEKFVNKASQVIKINFNITDLIITYIPISPQKLKLRGFNQSQILANELTKFLGIKCYPLLLKIKDNQAQMTLKNKKQREENVKNVFQFNKNYKDLDKAKRILIIDDIATTLSTLIEATKILKENGFTHIDALVVARQKH